MELNIVKNSFILLIALIFSGCSVKHERIKTYQAGDEQLSCEELKIQKVSLENKINNINTDETIQKTGNVLMGFFFLYDLSEPASLDYAQRRLERLEQLLNKCNTN